MKLKNLFLLTLGLACHSGTQAQNASVTTQNISHFEVESKEKAQRSIPDSLVKLDMNGDKMAQIIVESPLPTLVFENGGVYKDADGKPSVTMRQRGNNYQYVIDFVQNFDRLDVKDAASKYLPLPLELGAKVQPGEIWRVIINPVDAEDIATAELDEKDYKRSVMLRTDNFSNVYVDEELVSSGERERYKTVFLEEGKHYIHSNYRGGKNYMRAINVKKDGAEVDIRYGGEVEATNAQNVRFLSNGNPEPVLMDHDGRTWHYDNVYGDDYVFMAESSGTMVSKSTRKKFKMGSRGHKTFRVDELVPYFFLMYHGTIAEPFGLSIGGCSKFGWNFSWTYKPADSDYEENSYYDSYVDAKQMSFTTGPMWRVYRKFYLIAEGGVVNYDNDQWDAEASLKIMFRFRSFAFGLGYTKLFVDSDLVDMTDLLNFSVGFAF